MTVRNVLRSLVALPVAAVALVAVTANGATAAPATVAPAGAVTPIAACTPSPPLPPPAPGVGTAVIQLDRSFVTTLARAGVVVYATSPARTSLCLGPLTTRLTFPLEPTQLGAGTVVDVLDGRLVFRQVRTGVTLSLGIRTFYHPSVGAYVLSDQQLEIGQTIVFSLGPVDASGTYSLGFPNPDLINGPLGVDVAVSAPAGTLTLSYPT